VLLLLDSVHSWAQQLPGELGEYETLTAAVDALRRVAAQARLPILGVAERNRASMVRGGISASASTRRFGYAGESLRLPWQPVAGRSRTCRSQLVERTSLARGVALSRTEQAPTAPLLAVIVVASARRRGSPAAEAIASGVRARSTQ
jgi:hypothetical protein